MPRGDKSKYTDKQERKADHIAEGYEKRGVSEKEAERRAWATVNKDDGGGKKAGGSGRGMNTGHPAAHKGGKRAVRRSGPGRQLSAPHPRRRQRKLESETLSIALINNCLTEPSHCSVAGSQLFGPKGLLAADRGI